MKQEQFRPILKRPVNYKFDQPLPKYMLREAETEQRVHSPMKNVKEDSNTVVISASDVNRIKSSSRILTEADIARQRKEQYDERMRNSAIANQRKAMMLKNSFKGQQNLGRRN